MTTTSLPQDPAAIVSEVESFFAELPAKRRRRTKTEILDPDRSEENENYGKPALLDSLGAGRTSNVADDPAWALLLAWEIKGRVALLYRNTYKTPEAKAAKSALADLVTQLTTMAGGDDDAARRAAAIFWTLPFDRQQAISFHRVGMFFKDEVEFKRYLGKVA